MGGRGRTHSPLYTSALRPPAGKGWHHGQGRQGHQEQPHKPQPYYVAQALKWGRLKWGWSAGPIDCENSTHHSKTHRIMHDAEKRSNNCSSERGSHNKGQASAVQQGWASLRALVGPPPHGDAHRHAKRKQHHGERRGHVRRGADRRRAPGPHAGGAFAGGAVQAVSEPRFEGHARRPHYVQLVLGGKGRGAGVGP